ncbi:MAG: hypothetical protein MHM6MM_000379 [Cercozoa sp. M6MM]
MDFLKRAKDSLMDALATKDMPEDARMSKVRRKLEKLESMVQEVRTHCLSYASATLESWEKAANATEAMRRFYRAQETPQDVCNLADLQMRMHSEARRRLRELWAMDTGVMGRLDGWLDDISETRQMLREAAELRRAAWHVKYKMDHARKNVHAADASELQREFEDLKQRFLSVRTAAEKRTEKLVSERFRRMDGVAKALQLSQTNMLQDANDHFSELPVPESVASTPMSSQPPTPEKKEPTTPVSQQRQQQQQQRQQQQQVPVQAVRPSTPPPRPQEDEFDLLGGFASATTVAATASAPPSQHNSQTHEVTHSRPHNVHVPSAREPDTADFLGVTRKNQQHAASAPPSGHASSVESDDLHDILGAATGASPSASGSPETPDFFAFDAPQPKQAPTSTQSLDPLGDMMHDMGSHDMGSQASAESQVSSFDPLHRAPARSKSPDLQEPSAKAPVRVKSEKLEQEIRDAQAEKLGSLRTRTTDTETMRQRRLDARQTVEARMKKWECKNGVPRGIRALLSSLDTVLTWPGSRWKSVSLSDLISAAQVRKAHKKAWLATHPDKLANKDLTDEQRAAAEYAYDALNKAWKRFEATGK